MLEKKTENTEGVQTGSEVRSGILVWHTILLYAKTASVVEYLSSEELFALVAGFSSVQF
jgi:hypothetical protein